ncbi:MULTISPECIES: signal peptidase I [unclassified Thomasclavelia]|uniref:Signal peptidase I n=1 Tax=Candidatus Erysipelatoclostridium merdavium TaxID=2838566 RepID=A0A9D1XPL2_9FIRM|nr:MULTISPECIES: signal peptidase I [unclassified Thomasclavelia]OUP78833.1 signal peptidase I [Erysipelatoclostridium sp. An173]OUQ08374.1 signal peptidase I [Erysipelatoclostridium sp. An15]HIX82882.1 signal peptidase I [Candidatus Erysipelatoclostridium merdavium]
MEETVKSKKRVLLEYLRVIVITLIVTYGVLYFVQISRVYGTSMVPTFHEGNIVLVDKVFYKRGEPERNDIVVVDYRDANQNETFIIKRVVAVGGDHLEIKDNQVYLNGELLQEDYINGTMTNNEDMSIDIPEGKVFVMGDNRNNSLDSRRLGYFDFEDDVIGKVFFTVPFF